MKTFICTLLLLSATKTLAQTAPAESPGPGAANPLQVTPAYITQLCEEMESHNPARLAGLARTNAAGASLRAVRSWEDPTARVGAMVARENLRASDGDVIYGVEQKLPLFGKPGAARRVALASLNTETATSEYQFQTLRRELAKALYRTALAEEIVQLGRQDLAWLEVVEKTGEKRYGAGQASLVDALAAQNELAKRANQLQTDRNSLAHEQLGLNRFLNRNLHAPWPALSLPPLAEPVVYDERLVQFALRNEPKLKLLREQLKQAESMAEQTRRQRLPEVSVGLEGRSYTGDASFRQGIVLLGVTLPWLNGAKYRSDLHRDEAKVKAAEYELQDYELAVREDVHRQAIEIDQARREALLYQSEINPRNESALRSLAVAWEANRASFRDVLEARRMWLDGRLSYARAVANQYESLSDLVLCCGLGNLESLEMINALPKENP
jgi:cobalt-zinc-cadmium efflux system outer membrane protein